MSAAKRQDAGAAVGGLFDAAERDRRARRPRRHAPAAALGQRDARAGRRRAPRQRGARRREPRVRLGVELTERELAFLRALSRPSRTGQPRTLGAKFVATGVLAAAIELLAERRGRHVRRARRRPAPR